MQNHPSRREEALELLRKVADDLAGGSEVLSCLRNYRRAQRLLGGDEGWVAMELDGYPMTEMPSWRIRRTNVYWQGKGSYSSMEAHADVCIRIPVGELYVIRDKGGRVNNCDRVKTSKDGVVWVSAKLSPTSIEVILQRISERLFDLVSSDIVSLKFGGTAESVFGEYQKAVSQAMSKLGIEDNTQNAYENLQGGNKASWRISALACRNILGDLGRKLYQAPEKAYPYIEVHGKPMPVGLKNEVNRIRAYLHQNNIGADSLLAQMLQPLYEEACRGKSDINYKEAQSILINTYVFVGELARRTNMQPVTELHRPELTASSKKQANSTVD